MPSECFHLFSVHFDLLTFYRSPLSCEWGDSLRWHLSSDLCIQAGKGSFSNLLNNNTTTKIPQG